jgi:hypothetical protein
MEWSNTHSFAAFLPYCHYARIFITERQPRSVHYNDVSARDRLTTMITRFQLRAYASYTYE